MASGYLTANELVYNVIFPIFVFFILSRGSFKEIRLYFKTKKEFCEEIKQAELKIIGLDERLESLNRLGR